MTTDDKSLGDLIAVVCTKDRPERVSDFVQNLIRACVPPRKIVLVDSTTNPSWTDRNRQSLGLLERHGWEPHYISDTPGLPHQRNTALKFIALNFPSTKYVSFLDDDVFIGGQYFENVLTLFESDDDIVVVGGYDTQALQEATFESKILSRLGLFPAKHGMIARSGLARVPRPVKPIEIVDFVPGGMQSLRLGLLHGVAFNEESRFYGEDIEMHFKLSKNGKVVSSSLLPVTHLAATESKQDNGSAFLNEQLVRVRLHREDPERVRFVPLLAGCVLALVRELVGIFQSGGIGKIPNLLLEFGKAIRITIANRM